MKQSIFVKYAIWHERLQRVNKICCSNSTTNLSRWVKIQWVLMGKVSNIEYVQRMTLNAINTKLYELLLAKDLDGFYLNLPADKVNSMLLEYINECPDLEIYEDYKELALYAYDILKLK